MNRRQLSLLAPFGGAILALACGAGGVRPSFDPKPRAIVDTVNATPDLAIQDLAGRIIEENIQIAWQSPAEGYLETQWYNVVTGQSGGGVTTAPEQVVKIRFWADPIDESRSKVTAEAVFEQSADESRLPRDREVMVPRGHAGFRIINRVLEATKQRLGG